MFDGQNLYNKDTAYANPWNLQKVMDKLPMKYQAIIVGIDNGESDRIKEYIPKDYRKLRGEGDTFIDFIANELKPKVDAHLRTLTDKENTMIVGSSMGGLLSYYAGTRWGHVFGKIGVMSPAFWIYPSIHHFKTSIFSKFYIIGSKTESRAMANTLENTYWSMQKAGYSNSQFRIVIKDRGTHSESMWGREFGPMLRWLIG
jgi:predicted alpha/beta superfamily hydrolase